MIGRLVHVDDDPAHAKGRRRGKNESVGKRWRRRRRRKNVFVGQGHALPLGDHVSHVLSGGGKTGRSAHGHRIGWRRWPEAVAASEPRRRR